ncbi:MAG TPA: nicotinate-nucleotide--dimethylbenzimidazole phosphoribosyltransferase [Spirochaetia bacterium]|nr:nicotinate-nucleotide--dimethylbenzimidazole phosphoribosyltransferase [Spirochaetia bacterium]
MDDRIGIRVPAVDAEARRRARERADALLMPPRALGRLLELGEQAAGIAGFPTPDLSRKAIVVMAGDHGVTAEGVSAYPSEVTGQMVHGFCAGMAGINVLSRHSGITVRVVDMGCAADLSALVASGAVVDCKVAPGTRNLRREPAMTPEQAVTAIRRGAEVARALAAEGVRMLGTGDMGIGNTTPSAAIAVVATGRSARELTGRGTGVDDAGLSRKTRVIEESVAERAPDPRDGVDVLSRVGGFEIGGIAGLVLGAAECRLPVVIDGVISTAGAVIAWLLEPRVRDYLFAAHRSVEPAHQAMLELLDLDPILDLQMRLGEGTGCALAMPIIEAGVKVIREMATFAEAGVSGAS